jgi:hypothetical protein
MGKNEQIIKKIDKADQVTALSIFFCTFVKIDYSLYQTVVYKLS